MTRTPYIQSLEARLKNVHLDYSEKELQDTRDEIKRLGDIEDLADKGDFEALLTRMDDQDQAWIPAGKSFLAYLANHASAPDFIYRIVYSKAGCRLYVNKHPVRKGQEQEEKKCQLKV